MSNKKRVLIPLDGSSFSLQILESVKQFLPPSDNQLVLLTVEREPIGLVPGPTQSGVLTGSSNSVMYASHRDALRAHHPIFATQEQESTTAVVRVALQTTVRQLEAHGYDVQVAVRFGEPVVEIFNYLESTPIDLIAMTTHGRSGLGRLVFGSVAAELTRRAKKPILLLRPSLKS